MERTQFTFYESFFKAISRIKKDADRGKAYDAICAYALYGTEPDMDALPDAAAIAFELSKPNLDASRRKANNGKRGGDAKQTGSKPEASRKQTGSKSEANRKQNASKKEKESKREIEIENERYPPNPLSWAGDELQSAFSDWLSYKKERNEGYKPTGLRNLETEVRHNAERYGEASVAALIRKCMASNWAGIIFERLKNGAGEKGGNVFMDMLREEQNGAH